MSSRLLPTVTSSVSLFAPFRTARVQLKHVVLNKQSDKMIIFICSFQICHTMISYIVLKI